MRRFTLPARSARYRIAHAISESLEPRRLLAAIPNAKSGTGMADCGCMEGEVSMTAKEFAALAATMTPPAAPTQGGATTQGGPEAVSVGPVVNISRRSGNESEADIAINPTNPNQIFAVSNISSGSGLFMAVSNDAGQTWTTRIGATGSDIPAACCDARVEYDSFGNLFMTYLGPSGSNNYVARSTNNGASFTIVDTKTGSWDNPAITVSHLMPNGTYIVGIEARGPGGVQVYTGVSTGLGAPITFTAGQVVTATSSTGNFGDVAVLNDGSVLVTYTTPSGGQGPATDPVWRDPDGIGVGSGWVNVLNQATNVGGFDFFPAQSGRSVDSEPAFAVAPPGTPYAGRVYFTYTDEKVNENNDLDIMLRYSDDGGITWSAPLIVNDDNTQNSQFLQQIAVDRVTGAVALSWHDARNDNGVLPNGTNTVANDDAQFWGAVSTDGGVTFENFMIQPGWSNDNRAANGIDYGDWTGSDFYNGIFHAIWADNSQGTNGLPNNPTPNNFDLATARVEVQVATTPGVYGTVFDDANANGTRDGGEAGLAGVTVYADIDNSGTLNAGDISVVTPAGGAYAIQPLANGNYTIRAITPSGRRLTTPAGGAFNVTVSGSPLVNNNFGFVNPRVAGVVYNDANDNGVKEASENGIAGVTVYIDADNSGTLTAGDPTAVTGASGAYELGGLADGSYVVRVVSPAGNRLTAPSAGSFTVTINNSSLAAIDRNFGLTTTARIQGVVFNDANGNGVRDGLEGGIAGARVFMDLNNNGTFDNLGGTFNSTNVPLPIPPGAPTTTSGITTSNLVVSGALGAVQNLTVTLNITHTFTGDLVITLISPAGTRVTLVNRRGSSGDNFTNTTFDDAAATPITSGTAPFTGTFRPEQVLSTLNGQPANGTWQLEVNDAASGDVGTLNSWSISYGGVEPNVLTVADGAYSFPALPAGPYTIRQLPLSGYVFTAPPGGVYNLNAAAADLLLRDFGNSTQIVSASGFYVRVNSAGDQIEIFQDTVPSGAPDVVLDRASTPSINLVGSNSDDLLFVDLINGNPIPIGGLFFDGLAGNDSAILLGTSLANTARFTGSQIIANNRAINYSNTENIRFDGLGGDDRLIYEGSAAAPTFLGGAGTNTLQVDSGTWTYAVDGATQNDALIVDVRGGSVVFNATQHLHSMLMSAGAAATLASGGNKLIRVADTLSIDPSAGLNMNDGFMIVDYTGASPFSTIAARLASGYAGGAWNGNGMYSAVAASSPAGDALGYAEASAIFTSFPANFSGESVDNTTVVVRYTLHGDANLNGTVNIGDFSALASSFNTAGTWSSGDFNFNGTVNIADFSLLAANFNTSLPAARPAAPPPAGTTGAGRLFSATPVPRLSGLEEDKALAAEIIR